MNLLQHQKEAKELWDNLPKWHTIEFDLVDYADNRIKCRWVDPKAGAFTIGQINSGYVLVEDYAGRFPAVDNIVLVRK